MFKFLFLSIFILGRYFNVQAQDLALVARNSELKSGQAELNKYFKDYTLVQLDLSTLSKRLKSNKLRLTISLAQNELLDLELEEHSLLGPDYSAIAATAEGEQKVELNLAKVYKGRSSKSNEIQKARISLGDHFIYGSWQVNSKTYYIEPAAKFLHSGNSDHYILYSDDDVIHSEGNFCAATEQEKQSVKYFDELKSSAGCKLVELAIALDFSYFQRYGSRQAAINQSQAVMNLVDGDYDGWFSSNINFQIVQHYVAECSSCDNWGNSTDIATLLNNFTAWGPSGFSTGFDLGQLWSAQSLTYQGNSGVIGLAWLNAVCNTYRFHVLEDFSTTAWQLRVLTSHEIGHNFGANHDNSTTDNIMYSSVYQNTSSWTSNSVASVNGNLNSYTCLSNCFIGSCSAISNISISSCTPGAPSSYSLTFTLTHGGGGTSTGFYVNVNGQNILKPWSTSPQIVIINNLVADGTLNNTLTVTATDGSDSGCSGSGIYNEPNSECSNSITENFNSCSLPTGWASSTTNIYTFVDGNNYADPGIQYNWKFQNANRYFNNYNLGQNAGSLKTIDGTCMAIMDDDLGNLSVYAGTVTLHSSIYNFASIPYGLLEFDYNFHPFESGLSGKAVNSSYLNVDVWNGTTWINVLNANDSNCSWDNVWQTSCNNHASINISSSMNGAFKVRFVYNDGASWAGMAAIDNFKLTSSYSPINSCPTSLIINGPSASGNYAAAQMIQNGSNVSLSNATTFSAQSVEINPEFIVPIGVTLTISNGGCN